MNNVVSTFPLLRLPIDAILHTFRTMDPVQIFGVSLLSKKAKNLVESFKITANTLKVRVTDMLEINLCFPSNTTLHFKLYQASENQSLLELGTPENIHIHCNNQNMTWTNSMNVNQLLDHLKIIFHKPIDLLLFKENCERFSLESIHKNVTDVRMITISSGNHEHNKRILNLFQPASLSLVGRALVNQCVPRDILIQNFNFLHVPNVQITLDDLLSTSSHFIHSYPLRLSWKTLNLFLKLWVKGSNPRLEILYLEFPDNLGHDKLFRGLKYQDAPPERVRLFKTGCVKKLLKAYGGQDIWRSDGTQATFSFVIKDGFVTFGLSPSLPTSQLAPFSFIQIFCRHERRRLNIPVTTTTNQCYFEHNENYGLSRDIWNLHSLEENQELAESLKLKARKVEIDITDSFQITIFFSERTVLVFQFYQVQEIAPLQELETPETYHIQCRMMMIY